MARRRASLIRPRFTRVERLRAALGNVADTSSAELTGVLDALHRLVDLERDATDAPCCSTEIVACIRSRLAEAKARIDKHCMEAARA